MASSIRGVKDGRVTTEQLTVEVGDSVVLRGDRWSRGEPTVVLLHSGVCDRRSWRETADRLGPVSVVTYDRRGVGESGAATTTFRHIDDLRRVLDVVSPGAPSWLVGSSMGGRLALDLTVEEPERVAGLVLLAPAVSGAPAIEEVDPDTQRVGDLIDTAMESGDLDELNRLEMWLWLDGPTSPEGRVGGPVRSLALEMNHALLHNGAPEGAGASDIDAWSSLGRVHVPTTVACGDLDVPFFVDRCREVAARIPGARHQEIPGTAHLPYLEDSQRVADLILEAVSR
jgi:pimeloyl-ACP methyl ester carboxylesterase